MPGFKPTLKFPESYESGNWLLFTAFEPRNFNWNTADTAFDNAAVSVGQFVDNIRARSTGRVDRNTFSSVSNIALYLPEQITQGYGANWGNKELGIIADASEVIGQVLDGGSIEDILKAAGGASSKFGKQIAAGAAGILGFDVESAMQVGTNIAFNDHINLIFQDVPPRTFSFTFKMYPHNRTEAEQIEQIIHEFKINMMPTLRGGYFKIPNIWEIQYFRDSHINDRVGKIAACALTNCDVSYGEGEYVPIIDGSSWYNSLVTMKLSFSELSYLHRKLIEDDNF